MMMDVTVCFFCHQFSIQTHSSQDFPFIRSIQFSGKRSAIPSITAAYISLHRDMKKQTTNDQQMDLDCSFDQPIPATAVNDIAYGDDNAYAPYQPIPVKKLVDVFDSMAKVDGHMKVFVRVRPISKDAESTIKVESSTKIVTTATESSKRAQYTKQTERQYSFNYVFGPESTQGDVFGETVKPLINRFLLGESGLVIAYGMTNSGKTYTIQGRDETPGLLPLLIAELLDRTRSTPGCSVHMSMLEVYQDKIYDLQDPSKAKLQLRDGNGVVEVPKLSLHLVTASSDAVRLLQSASNNRSKSQTRLNAGSSRSHALYTVQLTRAAGAPGGNGKESSCTFQVVDLAGAERGNRTKATGSQQREANNINMSLMQLWRCLKLMRNNSCSSALYSSSSVTAAVAAAGGTAAPQPAPISASVPLPFRDSTLTHLLMPVLSRVGLKGVIMITCVNPHVDDYDETISILGNASLAIQIKEVADVNRTGGPVATSASAVIKQSTLNAAAAASSSRASSSVTAAATTVVAQSANIATAEPSTKNSLAVIKPAVSCTGAGGSKKRPLESSSRQTHGRKASTARKTSSTVQASQPLATLVEVKRETEVADSDDDTVFDPEIARLGGAGDESSEIKRLRLDVSRLHDENKMLQATQIAREAEIRIEVSKEMEGVSSKLLEQIEELQTQLDSRSTEYVDVAQSCKKIRRKQVNRANADDAREHLNEAEAEALRAKQAYEEEISRLKADITRLETELAEYRKNEKTKRSMSRSVSSSYIAAVTDKENLASKESSSRSSRSPLGPLDGNNTARLSSSPIKLETLASVSATIAAVSVASNTAPPRNLPAPALKIMAPSAQGSQATAAAATKASLRSRLKAAAAAATVEEATKQESTGQEDNDEEEPCSILSPMSVLKNHPYVRRLRTRQIRA